jgi:hypothetical protein
MPRLAAQTVTPNIRRTAAEGNPSSSLSHSVPGILWGCLVSLCALHSTEMDVVQVFVRAPCETGLLLALLRRLGRLPFINDDLYYLYWPLLRCAQLCYACELEFGF